MYAWLQTEACTRGQRMHARDVSRVRIPAVTRLIRARTVLCCQTVPVYDGVLTRAASN